MLFTYRWTWPSSGLMAVVVGWTIVAPVSFSTTCTLVPVTVALAAGCRISTCAGEAGRGPSEPDGAAACDGTPGFPQPPTSRATAAAATMRETNGRYGRGVMA